MVWKLVGCPLHSRSRSMEAVDASPHNAHRSPLLSLPSELRMQILRHLISDELIHIFPLPLPNGSSTWTYILCTGFSEGYTTPHASPPFPSSNRARYAKLSERRSYFSAAMPLLLTNRQLSANACHLLYTSNYFSFETFNSFRAFVFSQPRAVQRIRNIVAIHLSTLLTAGEKSRLRSLTAADAGHCRRVILQPSADELDFFLEFTFLALPQLRSVRLLLKCDYLFNDLHAHRVDARWAQRIVQLANHRRELSNGPDIHGVSSIDAWDMQVWPRRGCASVEDDEEQLARLAIGGHHQYATSAEEPPSRALLQTVKWIRARVLGEDVEEDSTDDGEKEENDQKLKEGKGKFLSRYYGIATQLTPNNDDGEREIEREYVMLLQEHLQRGTNSSANGYGATG